MRRSKTVEPSSEKPKKQDDKNYEIHNDSGATTSKSVATKSSALKSEETTDKTTSKTDEEKLTKQPTKRPTSKTSQGHGHRPKSSASRSTKSTVSPYATPLVTPSPYASRTSSAKSSRSSRPSSYKSTKSKTGSSKEDHTEEKEVVRHKEGIDRPKSRLGHPSPVDKGMFKHYILIHHNAIPFVRNKLLFTHKSDGVNLSVHTRKMIIPLFVLHG